MIPWKSVLISIGNRSDATLFQYLLNFILPQAIDAAYQVLEEIAEEAVDILTHRLPENVKAQ